MRRDLRVAVVTPLANEALTVRTFLQRVTAQLGPHDAVFCVVDNATRDDTVARVAACAGEDPRVQLVWAPESRCVADAYFRGYREAYDAGAEWILEMDGGFSHLPEEIPRFLALIGQDYDYVAGCRFMEGGSHRGSSRRLLISRWGSLLAQLLLRTRMRDMTSGFEMFSRRALALVLERGARSRGPFFQTEIKYAMHDLRWIEVPITYQSTSGHVDVGAIWEALRVLESMRRARGGPRRGDSA